MEVPVAVFSGGLMDDKLNGVGGVEIVEVETVICGVVGLVFNGGQMAAADKNIGLASAGNYSAPAAVVIIDFGGDGGVDETDNGVVGGTFGVVGLSFGEVKQSGAFVGQGDYNETVAVRMDGTWGKILLNFLEAEVAIANGGGSSVVLFGNVFGNMFGVLFGNGTGRWCGCVHKNHSL